MRFVPRYSLRFALLALTIFLIVFSVGAKYWRAYHEHERVASELIASGNKVEEEADTLFGYVIGKRITSLQLIAPAENQEASLDLLEQLPEPLALRRLDVSWNSNRASAADPFSSEPQGTVSLDPTRKKQLAVARTLARLHNLEALDLSCQFDAEVVQAFQHLKNLRQLTLSYCEISEGQLEQTLRCVPQLEMFYLYAPSNKLAVDGLFQANLPQLQILGIQSSKQRELHCQKLPFNRQGLGRYPNLEYLTLAEVQVQDLEVEAGALPKLKMLEFEKCRVAEEKSVSVLFPAMPQLEALAIELQQLDRSVVSELNAAPVLRHLCLWEINSDFKQLKALREKNQLPSEWIPQDAEKFDDLVRRCQGLTIYSAYYEFTGAVQLPSFLIQIPSWDSDHWRTETLK